MEYIEGITKITEEDWKKMLEIIEQYRDARKTRYRPIFVGRSAVSRALPSIEKLQLIEDYVREKLNE